MIYHCINMATYIEYALFQPFGCRRGKKITGEKKLRIFGVEIFGVEFWSAQHEPKITKTNTIGTTISLPKGPPSQI
jgi:hypothetical protein